MSSLRINSLLLLLARGAAYAFSFLFIVLVARRLDVEAFGKYSYAAALVFIGNTVTNFGTDTFLIRDIARTRQITQVVSRALTLQLFLSGLWILASLALRDRLAFIYSLALIPMAFTSVITAAFRGFERMDISLGLSLANGIAQIGAALISFDVQTLIISLVVGIFILGILAYWIGWALLPDFNLLPLNSFYPIFRPVLPFAMLTIFMVLAQRLGVLTVSTLLGDSATGIFSSVIRIVDGLKLGHYAVLGALLPVISRGTYESKQSFNRGFASLMSISLLMAIGLAILPRFIILTLYGAKFASAIPLLAILGWSLIPYTISSFISYDLVARGQELMLVKATALSLVLFLILYLWLISAYQLNGAVYAALAGEIVQAMIFVLFQSKSVVERKQSKPPE